LAREGRERGGRRGVYNGKRLEGQTSEKFATQYFNFVNPVKTESWSALTSFPPKISKPCSEVHRKRYFSKVLSIFWNESFFKFGSCSEIFLGGLRIVTTVRDVRLGNWRRV
jgi:hypothetical protein